MKNEGRLAVILLGLCSAIWTIRVIYDVIYQTYNGSTFGFVLNIICAMTWIASFIVNLKRYNSNKKKDK